MKGQDNEERQRRIRNSFLKVFCSSDDGIIVLRELSRFAGADSAEFCNDPRKSDYLLGRRSVVLQIRNIINDKENDDGE